MVSLNYKNSVIKSILKEEFNAEEFINQYKQLSLALRNIGIDSKKFYTTKEKNELITIYYSTTRQYTKPFYDLYQLEDMLDNIDGTTSSNLLEINHNNDNKGFITTQKFNKLIVYVRDTIYTNVEKDITVVYYSKTKPDNFESVLTNYFQKSYTINEITDLLRDRISPIFDKQNKNLKKYSKDFIKDLTNAGLDTISKELEVIPASSLHIYKNSNIKDPIYNTDKNYCITDSSRKNNENKTKKKRYHVLFDPQHLIQTHDFMSVRSVEKTVQQSLNNLFNAGYLSESNEIPYIAGRLVYNTIENVANGNAGNKVNIFEGIEKDVNLNKKHGKSKTPREIDTLKYYSDGEEKYFDTNSTGYSIIKQISTQPVEIFSPMILATMDKSIVWGHDGDMTSKEILNKIFGENNIKNSLISYPKAGEMFFDSKLAVPQNNDYRMIKVSTKGGVDGVGAHASMLSLYNMLFDTTGHKRYDLSEFIETLVKESRLTNVQSVKDFVNKIKLTLSPYTLALVKDFPAETAILIIFGGTSDSNHEKIFNTLKVNGFFGLDFSQCNKISSYIKVINSSLHITDAVMRLLNYQKYEIAQVNCQPHIEGDKFWYTYAIQYPAHFNGSVDIERNAHGGLSFHILASK